MVPVLTEPSSQTQLGALSVCCRLVTGWHDFVSTSKYVGEKRLGGMQFLIDLQLVVELWLCNMLLSRLATLLLDSDFMTYNVHSTSIML